MSTSASGWSHEFKWDDVGNGPTWTSGPTSSATWEQIREACENMRGGAPWGGTKHIGPFTLRAGAAIGPNRLLVQFQGKRYGIANTEPAIRSLLGQLRADVRRAADLEREAEEKRRGETTTLPPARDVQGERARAFAPFLRAFEV